MNIGITLVVKQLGLSKSLIHVKNVTLQYRRNSDTFRRCLNALCSRSGLDTNAIDFSEDAYQQNRALQLLCIISRKVILPPVLVSLAPSNKWNPFLTKSKEAEKVGLCFSTHYRWGTSFTAWQYIWLSPTLSRNANENGFYIIWPSIEQSDQLWYAIYL